MNNYLYQEIGNGYYAKVIKVYNKDDLERSFAIKIPIKSNTIHLKCEEIYANKNINNKNLVKTFLCTKNSKTLVMKYYNSSYNLYHLISKEEKDRNFNFNRYV